jgi:hypothetical protein
MFRSSQTRRRLTLLSHVNQNSCVQTYVKACVGMATGLEIVIVCSAIQTKISCLVSNKETNYVKMYEQVSAILL